MKVELVNKITSFKQARPRVTDIFNKYRGKTYYLLDKQVA